MSSDLTGEVEGTTTEMGQRHLRGSSLLLLGRVASIGFTMATQVIIVRALTKADFGGFALALTIASASRLLLSLGQGKTLSRFLAIYVERKDYGRLWGSVLIAAATVVVTGTTLITVLVLLREDLVGTLVQDSSAATVLLIVVLLAPLEAVDQLFVSIFAVLTKPRAIFFRKYMITPGLRLVVVLAVVAADAGVVALSIGYVGAELLGVLLYVTMLRGVMRDKGLLAGLRWRDLSWPVRSVFTFAFPMLSAELVYLSMNTGSVLLLNHFYGAVQVADLRAVIPAAHMNKIVYSTFITLYLPMASRLFARGDHDGLRRDYWRTAAFLAVLSFPLFAMTAPFAHATTVVLFGERYEGSAVILAVLSTGYFLNSALGFNMVTLQAYGKVRFLLLVNLFAAALNIALSLLLIPDHGALGVAVAHCATLVAQNLANQIGLMRVTGSPLVERSYLGTYGSLFVATLLLWGLNWLLDPGMLVAVLATVCATVLLLVVNRSVLELGHTFPELARVPVLRWLAGPARPR
ncbi:MAG: oligosaccharide flippase family protein [Actinomycetes bacterium]